MTNEENQRTTAATVLFAGALATGVLFALSDVMTIERTILVASIPAVVAGLVGGLAVVRMADREGSPPPE